MKNERTYAKTFAALYKRIKAKFQPEAPAPDDPVTELVRSFLQWEATAKQARAAYDQIMAQVVDHNDLRVSRPDELISALGVRYPMREERLLKLHDALQGVFLREHAISLDHLSGMTKKQARNYLDTLTNIPPYVAARVTLLCFQGHAIPVDEPLACLLKSHKAADPDATIEEVESFLHRQVRAANAMEAHLLLQAWVEATPQPAPAKGSSTSRTTKKVKKSTKKAAAKKTATTKPKAASKTASSKKTKATTKPATAKKTVKSKKTTKKKKSTKAASSKK